MTGFLEWMLEWMLGGGFWATLVAGVIGVVAIVLGIGVLRVFWILCGWFVQQVFKAPAHWIETLIGSFGKEVGISTLILGLVALLLFTTLAPGSAAGALSAVVPFGLFVAVVVWHSEVGARPLVGEQRISVIKEVFVAFYVTVAVCSMFVALAVLVALVVTTQ